ncbi:Glu/Leu/Phe/Val dehydrogenase [Patulibacter sp. SYSU D01012]|uniref:Glu/Leu/Phe/Val dehydrogenase n=1 Tax=Patulibacter sp. SYSU D01012 TaxID=2817381 RepID=UPI001B300B29|nr:Glu/Leu/Phe/Val dehydrogenase [Patulibacter sp. SYSU D01012]
MSTRPGTEGADDAAGVAPWGSEQLVLCHDEETGLRAAIAVDDTTLGPALGGVRYKAYPSSAAAITEAQRLAAAMTRKNAAAGLPYGGGKSVILNTGPVADRTAFMRAFGRFVARLGGAYVPGVDMGTTTDDLATMARAGAGITSGEDPSPATAAGVFEALRAAVRVVDGRDDLTGVRVLVQGAGHVGAALARDVARAGGTVLLSDVDAARAADVAGALGGQVVAPDAVLDADVDVFAPCAIARVIDATTVERLRCRIVAGAANDTLAFPAVADRLVERGITYVPDFVANAGGVIHMHGVRMGWDATHLRTELALIGDRIAGVLTTARETGVTPLAAAEALAAERIAAARAERAQAPSVVARAA